MEEGEDVVYKAKTCPRSRAKQISYVFMRISGPLLIESVILIFSGYVFFLISIPLIRFGLYTIPLGIGYLVFCIFTIYITNLSLFRTIFGDIGSLEDALNDPEIREKIEPGLLKTLPRCEKCGLPKPERCHHCSVCNKCNLKLDHHCPAIGICVTVRNQQPFLSMLWWGGRALFIISVSAVIRALIAPQLLRNLLIDLAMSSMAMIMSAMVRGLMDDQIQNIETNRTTLEALFDLPPKYDKGIASNRIEFLGDSPEYSWWPKKSKMTGFEWCPQHLFEETLENSDLE